MVAQDVIVVGLDVSRGIALMVQVFGRDVRFLQRRAVDVNPPVAYTDELSRQPDHALDVRLRGVERVLEHDDVPAFDGLETVYKLIDEDPLMILQAGHHAGALHLHRLVEENNHHEGQKHCQDQVAEPIAGLKKATALARDIHARVGLLGLIGFQHKPCKRFYTIVCGRLSVGLCPRLLVLCHLSVARCPGV